MARRALFFGLLIVSLSGCVSHGVRAPAASPVQASVPEGYLAPGRALVLENPIEFRNLSERPLLVERSARSERLICRAELMLKPQTAVVFDAGTQLTVMSLTNVIRAPGAINVPEASYSLARSDGSGDPIFSLSCSLSSGQNPEPTQIWTTQNFDPAVFGYLRDDEVIEILNFLAINSNLTQGDVSE